MSLSGIPLKKTCVEDIKTPLRHILGDFFHNDDAALEDIERMTSIIQESRDKVAHFSLQGGLESAKSAFSGHLAIVMVLQRHLKDDDSKTPFIFMWGDTAREDQPVTYSSFSHEIMCLVYNLGSVYSRMGRLEDRNTEEGIKKALGHFRMSASIMACVKTYLPKTPVFPATLDLTEEFLSFWVAVMLAQAQQCLYEKAIMKKCNKKLLTKLAMLVSVCFDSALKYGEILVEYVPSYMLPWFSIQKLSFASAAYFHQMHEHRQKYEKTGSGIGLAIAGLRKAQGLCDQASKLSEKHRIRIDDSQLRSLIRKELDENMNENTNISHELIPSESEVECPEVVSGISLLPLNLQNLVDEVETEVTKDLEEFLSRLVPFRVHCNLVDYKNKVVQFYTGVNKKLKNAVSEVQNFLSTESLPYAADPHSSFPENLWGRILEVRLLGGIHSIPERISFLDDAALSVERRCEDLRRKLGNKLNEDYTFVLWEIEAAEANLKGAVRVNTKLKEEYDEIELFEFFECSRERAENIYYNLDCESVFADKTHIQKALQTLDVAVKKAETTELEFGNFTENFRECMITSAMKSSEKQLESELASKLEEADHFRGLVEKDVDVVNRFLSKCKLLWDREKTCVTSLDERTQLLVKLESSVSKAENILDVLSEGSQFFSNLIERLKSTAARV